MESGVHALLSRIAKAEHTSGGKALVAEESTIAAEDSVSAASRPVSNRAGRPDRPQRLHQSRCQRRQSCGRIDPASTGATAISRPAAACAGVAIP